MDTLHDYQIHSSYIPTTTPLHNTKSHHKVTPLKHHLKPHNSTIIPPPQQHPRKLTTLSLTLLILVGHMPTTIQANPPHKNILTLHKKTNIITPQKGPSTPTHQHPLYVHNIHTRTLTNTHTTPPPPPHQSRIQHPKPTHIHRNITFITFYIIKHIHHKHTTIHKITTHIVDLQPLILLSGDVHPNLGPLKHILNNLPKDFTKIQRQYFITHTLKLKPHYQHLEEFFAPYLTTHTPTTHIMPLPHLQRHNILLLKYPPHYLLDAFIIALSPLP